MAREDSGWLNTLGILAAGGVAWQAIDVVYTRTYFTWAEGDQDGAFQNFHILGPLILLPVLLAAAYMFSLLMLVFVYWLEHRKMPKLTWPLPIVLIICFSLYFVPYRVWKRATFTLKGPGPHAAQFLVWAAHDGDRRTVELLLNRGVPVDIRNGTATALDAACAGGHAELAEFLISKGADIRAAPDCTEVR